MNLTLRVVTNRRDLILKQARPWVEKYDDIPAPWDRAHVEIEFYRVGSGISGVREHIPELRGFDEASRSLLMEFIDGGGDHSDLYRRDPTSGLDRQTLTQVAHFLAALHGGTLDAPEPRLRNLEMRELNRAHIYEIPLTPENGLDLDALEPGLANIAASLRDDTRYRAVVAETQQRYLEDGPCLLHGDFFPGSWLRSERGLVVIDPEFSFFGAVEIDLGCAIGHLALAGQPLEAARELLRCYRDRALGIDPEEEWVSRFASIEVMRRLIGVAQLPIPVSGVEGGLRTPLLERSRDSMLGGRLELLFD